MDTATDFPFPVADMPPADALVLASLPAAQAAATDPDRAELLEAVLMDDSRSIRQVLERAEDHDQLLGKEFFEPLMILATFHADPRVWDALSEWNYGLSTKVQVDGHTHILGELAAALAPPEHLDRLWKARLLAPLARRRLRVAGLVLGGPEQFDFWRPRLGLDAPNSAVGPSRRDLDALELVFQLFRQEPERARRLEALASDAIARAGSPGLALSALVDPRFGTPGQHVEAWMARHLLDATPSPSMTAQDLLVAAAKGSCFGVIQVALERGADPTTMLVTVGGDRIALGRWIIAQLLRPSLKDNPNGPGCWAQFVASARLHAPHLLDTLPASWPGLSLPALRQAAGAMPAATVKSTLHALDMASVLPPVTRTLPSPRL